MFGNSCGYSVKAGILGDTVNFRSTIKSFKNKKIERPQEEWKVLLDTHPAIIDREVFAPVQELRQHCTGL